jgi:hypothetical protein
MAGENVDELRQELTRLEAEEGQVSAQRRYLHQQIDFGYATDETRAREREISDRRRKLHHRIDELRALLGVELGAHGDGETQGVAVRFEGIVVDDAGDDLEREHLL